MKKWDMTKEPQTPQDIVRFLNNLSHEKAKFLWQNKLCELERTLIKDGVKDGSIDPKAK